MQSIYRSGPKRLVDIVAASVALCVLSPIICIAMWVVARSIGRPVIFRQERAGLLGRSFVLLKLRTMSDQRGSDGRLLSDEQRLGRVGRWLRASSIDELPTLINVVRGEMSLIGPRPLHVRYLPRYNSRQAKRHDVRPGLTGLAQIHGRNSVPWPERLEYDVQYSETCSLLLDIQIVFQTIWLVIRRSGITQPGFATAEEFVGDQPRNDT